MELSSANLTSTNTSDVIKFLTFDQSQKNSTKVIVNADAFVKLFDILINLGFSGEIINSSLEGTIVYKRIDPLDFNIIFSVPETLHITVTYHNQQGTTNHVGIGTVLYPSYETSADLINLYFNKCNVGLTKVYNKAAEGENILVEPVEIPDQQVTNKMCIAEVIVECKGIQIYIPNMLRKMIKKYGKLYRGAKRAISLLDDEYQFILRKSDKPPTYIEHYDRTKIIKFGTSNLVRFCEDEDTNKNVKSMFQELKKWYAETYKNHLQEKEKKKKESRDVENESLTKFFKAEKIGE